MIRIFGATEGTNDFNTSNGDAVIMPTKAKIHKEDNGDYYLDLECGLEYVDFMVSGNIIVANTPQGNQPFRISDYTKNRMKVKVKAQHVFFDSKNYLIADSYVVDGNCNYALDHLNSATEPASIFTTSSDVNTIASFRCVRKSLYEAINTIIDRWGGHLVRDGFSIQIKDSIGTDNGVTVRYAKNLKEISVEENWTNVVTKLMPVGRDGLLLPEVYVTATNTYDIPFTKTVTFSQNIDKDEYESEEAYQSALVEDLRHQAIDYVTLNSVPMVNYTLKANLEKITDIGDTVEVIDERLGLNLMTNVIAFDYDCILEKYTEVQFGNFQNKLSSLMGSIRTTSEQYASEAVEVVRVTLGEELQEATNQIMSVLGDSNVIYDGDKIMVVDSLPKETATNVLMINSAGIGFSTNGIAGPFNSAWLIDGTLDMQQINVINLVADMIKGGTLKLGSQANSSGILELYDNTNNLVGLMNKDGLKMYGADGSYVLMNNTVGFAGYDHNNTMIYWVSADEFHMKKSVVEEEITLCAKMRFIPITVYSGNSIVNDGIGLVAVGG